MYKRQLDLLGTITGGMTSTPGLAAADSMTDSNIPSVAYATVYPIAMVFLIPVSYTHLDVYKRQARNCKTRNTTCCCNIIQGAIAEKQQGKIAFILRIRDAKSRFNLF